MTIGERIKNRRRALGISQVSLADKIGVSKQSLYKYECGIITNIPSDKIEELASALGTTPAYLMGWATDRPPAAADPLLPLSREEGDLVRKYRSASDDTKAAVCAVLGVKKDAGLLDSRLEA